jgi:hypothetical protein
MRLDTAIVQLSALFLSRNTASKNKKERITAVERARHPE